MAGRWWPVRPAAGWAPLFATATRAADRAWTRAGDPVQLSGISSWRRRGDASAALAWVTPVSGARCLVLAAHVRALPDRQLHELLSGLPQERFDRLVEAA